jgi:MoCo/4Fe-4S cofactor protein with predicted Tat translocation signal
MSDQCPSTVHGEKAKPGKAQLAALRRSVGTVNGLSVWRSAEELADSPEFREHLEKEFPHGALELQRAVEAGGESRRDFLKIMGGSIALAGLATIPGCRQPDHKILPYSKEVPEDIIIGKPLYYATAMARPDGGAEGLLVETHEGRPTKIEGNPLHPFNNGKASMWALASIMGLYDPDRLKYPTFAKADLGDGQIGQADATWDDFRMWSGTEFAQYATNGGEGLGFIVGKASSPTLEAAKAAVLKKYPKASWAWWAPTEQLAAAEGARIAFGTPMREQLNLSKETVNVIVSLDRDFLYHESDELPNSRGFSRSREVWAPTDTMSRLYVIESGFSITGGQADHRLPLAPSRIAAATIELAKAILPKLSDANSKALSDSLAKVTVPAGDDLSGAAAGFLRAAAEDLLDAANREKALVLVGQGQPAELHALSYAINAALGSLGKAQTFQPLTDDEAANSTAQLAALTAKAAAGNIKTLVVVNANPAYDAPGDLKFADAWAKVLNTVTLSVGQSETAAASTWALNGTHYLESWGDVRAADGTVSVVQPMIAPLYDPVGSRAVLSELELLTLIAGGDFTAKVDGHDIVRTAVIARSTNGGSMWRRALHDGLIAGTTRKAAVPALKFADVARSVSSLTIKGAPTQAAMDVTFAVGHLHDGRFANIAWLQELPEVATRTVWDNPALVSGNTAKKLGLAPAAFEDGKEGNIYTSVKYPKAQLAELTLNGVTVTVPIWVCPGLPDDTIQLTFGYGRSVSGRVADGVGINVFALRTTAACQAGLRIASGAALSGAKGSYMISSTQNHWSMEGRTAIVRAVDLPAWQQHGSETQKIVDRFYGTDSSLNFAERLGELSHMPPKLSIYENPYNNGVAAAEPNSIFATGMQWAMTIDQSTCTGCGACTLACQSENNIPVVGKKEVAKGREMTWIRVDRYFTGDFDSPQNMFHQPVACVHCENAPCEVVCPVNATVHGPEGLNYMTYNRCIGTRYCANNCPYKVRRYNFFEYGKLAFNGDYIGKDVLDQVGGLVPGQGVGPNGSDAHNKFNINLVPPRLREKITQIEQMQKNPNVTVRMRGVMEKCSYCIQRINEARIETKLQGLPGIPDGFFQAACQQACPSNAIIFGDMRDPKSRVHASRANARSYALLGYLNTRPRTTHMLKVMNPNPVLCSESRKHGWADPFHHAHEEGHEKGGHDDHGSDGGHGKDKSHAFFDKGKAREDRGYAASLKVLSPQT